MRYVTNKYAFQISLCATMLFVFCFEAMGIVGISSITNNSSEYNVIAMAADLAGYDWKDTILKTHYYGYTASILFSFVFAMKPIASNPLNLLHALLLVNVLINSICAGVLFLIVSNVVRGHNWKLNYSMVMLITTASSLLISNQVLTKSVTNENVFMLCYYIAIYIITCGNKKKIRKSQIINSIFLALVCVIAYATNGRGVILIIISVLMYIVFKMFKITPFGDFVTFLVACSFLFVLAHVAKGFFIENYFQNSSDTSMALKNSDAGGIIKKLFMMINLKGLKLFMKLVVGWGTYFMVSTYGWGIIAILSAIQCVWKKIKYQDEICDIDFGLAMIMLLFISGMAVLGICFYYDSFYAMTFDPSNALANGRVDKLIYGRYISTIKSVILSYGLIKVIYTDNCLKKLTYISFCVFIIFEILFYKEIVPLMVTKRYAAVDIPEFALFFQNLERNYKFGIIKSYLPFKLIFSFTLICYTVLLYIARKQKPIYFLGVILFLNISIGIAYTFGLSFPRAQYYRNLINQDQVEYVRKTYDNNSLIITDNNAYLYQFFMPQNKVISLGSLREEMCTSYKYLIFLNPDEETLNNSMPSHNKDNILILSENKLGNGFRLLNEYNTIKEYTFK